ncbi:DUF559 domain-containing protein [Hamadaea tsunoensis]|uniref:DUF559 domain-containing protein n=1 Tax=Hamadaea tsunoensis TaxID=53368 RepID=UPI0004146384|nr:DUF559 domain-containing protein [Hamadaea tsunoensis]
MHPALAAVLRDGPFSVAELPPDVPRWLISNARRAGWILQVLPGVYVPAHAPVDLHRAAIVYTRDQGALSHTTALGVWGLREAAPGEPIHVVVHRGVRLRSTNRLVLHTRHVWPPTQVRAGLPVTAVAESLVDSWPAMAPVERPGPFFAAITGRLTTADRLAEAVSRSPHLAGRAALVDLVGRLAAGCHSPLEIFGADVVFAGLSGARRQVPVIAGGRRYYLDLYLSGERIDIELDGASWHSSAAQRENDMRRDAALAAQGILVVRFSYRRLVNEPRRVRAEVEEIITARRS